MVAIEPIFHFLRVTSLVSLAEFNGAPSSVDGTRPSPCGSELPFGVRCLRFPVIPILKSDFGIDGSVLPMTKSRGSLVNFAAPVAAVICCATLLTSLVLWSRRAATKLWPPSACGSYAALRQIGIYSIFQGIVIVSALLVGHWFYRHLGRRGRF